MPAWYYKLGPIVAGPLSVEEIRSKAAEGGLRPETLVREGASGSWVEARSINGLFSCALNPLPAVANSTESQLTSDATGSGQEPTKPAQLAGAEESSSRVRQAGRQFAAIALILSLCLAAPGTAYLGGPSSVPDLAIGNPGEDQEDINGGDQIAQMRKEIAELRMQIANVAVPKMDDPKNDEAQRIPDADEGKSNDAIADLVDRAEPSVVQIVTTRGDQQIVTGAGFIAGAGGLVITNYHVIEGAAVIAVIFQDNTRVQTQGYRVVAPGRDIAVIEVELPANFRTPLEISPNEARKGEEVVAFGSPLGLQNSVSTGVVSANRIGDDVRDMINEKTERGVYESLFDIDARWVQTTAPISHGNSGGPLTDSSGRVVGMNTWSASFANAGAQNVNFAIAASELRDVLNSAKNASIKYVGKLPPARDLAGRPVQPDGPPRPVNRPGPPDMNAPAANKQREQLSLLFRIYDQCSTLTARWELARTKLQKLQVAYSSAHASLVKVEMDGAKLRQTGASLEQQAATIRDRLSFERDPGVRLQLQSLLNNAVQSYGTCQARYQWLDSEADRLRLHGSKLQEEVNSTNSDVERLFEQSNQLRSEWLTATNAFGKLIQGDYPAAVAAFSEWIVLEADNPMPYVARGLAHRKSGRTDLAAADFQKASRLDPKTTAKMIREFEALQNGKQQNAPRKKRR